MRIFFLNIKKCLYDVILWSSYVIIMPVNLFHVYSFFLDRGSWPEGSYELGSARPSVLPSFCPEVFLGLVHYFFLKLSMMLGAHVLCVTGSHFLKKIFFPQKWGKWAKKQGFLNLLEIFFINFFWIWSLKKVYNTYCILVQIPYLGKIWFLWYGPKCSRSIRLQYF